jgi:putative membrane protein
MSEPRRLHPAGIVVAGLEDLRGVLVPALVVAVVSGGLDSLASAVMRVGGFALIGAVVAAVSGYIRWANTWYSVADGGVRLRSGILEHRERTIPLDRLQSVDESQGPVQRLLGVRQVRLQAAGGREGAEIKLGALSSDDVEALRAAVAGAAPAAVTAPEPSGPARRLPLPMLLLAGVTSAQLGFLIPVAAAASQAVDEVAEPLVGWVTEGGTTHSAATVLVAAAVVIGAAWLVAFLATVIAFAGFSIERRGDRLRVTRGLFVRRESTIPVDRIQGVLVVDGIVRQPLRMTQLRVETAGYSDERAYERTLFPLLARGEVEGFLGELLPELSTPAADLRRPPARALRRYLLRPAALPALVALVLLAAGAAPAWPTLAAAVAVVAGAHGALRFRAAGWSVHDRLLVARGRRLARWTLIARAGSVDIRGTTQDPLQRRARLASLRFAIASRRRAEVAHVDVADAGPALVALAPR